MKAFLKGNKSIKDKNEDGFKWFIEGPRVGVTGEVFIRSQQVSLDYQNGIWNYVQRRQE